MAVRRIPNNRLRGLLTEAGWTGEQLARAVNQIAAESGQSLSYQRASVHQWLTGTVPRPPAAQLVCAALGRRLRRRITLTEAGFGAPRPEPAVPPDTGALLARLAAAALTPDRRGDFLVYQPLCADQLTDPPDPPGPPDQFEATAAPGGRPPTDPDTLALLLPAFSAVDRIQGGGQARTALAAFLATTVAPMLAAPAPPVRRAGILSGAARLSYLCAFMQLDDELNGLANQYYRLSLTLAREAGDTAGQAMALRAMAALAYELGLRAQGLRLAQAAADCHLAPSSVRLRAAVLGQLALSEAAVGDRTAAHRHLGEARDRLAGATGPPPAVGDYHRASWDHQRALVHVELGDRAGAIKFLEASTAHRPRTESRSRAVVLSRLAEAQLAAGHLAAACTTWHEFLDLYPLLDSRRARSAAERLRRLLLPHRRAPGADHLLQRAASLHPH
ncbi:hypothetical protein C7C46_14085 [Streptomyces tateyamensis]|uniref:Transcriptional regulator n=1 Tax=Streptomyces tateyamensis TaxID=565073 RepID=A0A2V4N5H9_9ACTN|nr:hypothetical protein [Streptomyces tateyamensis]PYC79491.1 hypothetical protein C7C46_14085 [Streptomyces tateyamensis]